MNAREMTYGIEIECLVPSRLISDGTIPVGGYHIGRQVPALPAGWNAQRDGSLHTTQSGMTGVEIVSPILRGDDGLRQIQRVLQQLRTWEAETNRSCGFHVHVGWTGDASQLKRLTHLVANFESALYASTGTRSRETGNFCRSIRRDFQQIDYRQLGQGYAASDRYHILNLANLATNSKPTVEFRAFAGTLNFSKIVGHISTCVALVEQSLKASRTAAWESRREAVKAASNPAKRGQIALTRLFYQLGWIKGRTDQVHGDLTAHDLPTLKQIKSTLMGLARKYDQGQEE